MYKEDLALNNHLSYITEISPNLLRRFKPAHQQNEKNKNTWKENPASIRFN